ncbi:GNAT family N-acetyltransferase [Aurantimonas marianensis]|uniref:GNAT family N-acetyltransferase n=1 Tax=Aurantimonas marianensis TaxID=2920428 RepID=A0A9X2H5E9_9HYPH|nr:GNAT family N-acetyltransferase [Aurantimonas marianensis]MCP3053793.1 GNAT family N-acetyltransferase [Aurantimonas marianensis]
MLAGDLAGVAGLAERVHPDLPEDAAVFRDRLRLYPRGCLVLGEADGPVLGYAIGHPWRGGAPPKLDAVLGALPKHADCFYIHDVVVAPERRGAGHSRVVVETLLELAVVYPCTSLVSVHGTTPFWSRFGFRDASDRLVPGALDAYGPAARFMRRSGQK